MSLPSKWSRICACTIYLTKAQPNAPYIGASHILDGCYFKNLGVLIILKYDLVTAVQCGNTDKPDQVMKEQGYSWSNVIYTKEVNFYEVESIQHPLPPFLEASDVLDGRFDPRINEIRAIPASIGIVEKMDDFDQDPVVMTMDFEPNSSSNQIAEEEKARQNIQGIKAKRSSNTKK